ncbi:hypothetical protein THAOC_35396 [Thalassiosira oceanica]|uniref:Major facilitator superfamily (MFS) profile domain-containing protein n=1 Tax=Thalassiosira oceanica TaxID=159749 RepID=K0R3G0_THAOC|nr:hypothetical protein THAOC_35396 [Thalassiosira oceanica]|mmetsp:Transcript_32146/g.76841  ORF Transcript_32146/g.76841 Transcript_32146/m.76841 type:complete len:497 (+) Transcript_32146:287-1777(+)|eukprot:EJK45964.1 hypothetical protein THAOC_35396 [Thalassiosira oceanica]
MRELKHTGPLFYGDPDTRDDEDRSFQDGDSDNDADTPLPSSVPSLFRFESKSPVEATGLAINALARGAVGISTLFLGPALLKLANDAAQENCKAWGDCSDGGRVYGGMRPTSLLTNIGIFSGLFSSLMTPIFGAIVDHTSHRKAVGQFGGILLSLIKGLEVFIGPKTWLAISMLQVLNFVVYQAHLCSVFAYTAELSTNPHDQTTYNARFQQINYLSMLGFLLVVVASSKVFHLDDVQTAKVSQAFAFFGTGIVFSLTWTLFMRPRPALSQTPQNSTLVQAGFCKLRDTSQHIWRHWRAPRFFLMSAMQSESATQALSTVSTTFMKAQLEMSAAEIGQTFFCVFVAGLPGAYLADRMGKAVNPKRSAMVCLCVLIINTTLAATLLTGPETKGRVYMFAGVWGLGLGWLYPTHSALYCTIIPRGQESELMGIYLCSGSVLSFLPPLIFSFLNEIGMSMSVGMMSLNIFFTGGFVCLCLIDYTDACQLALGGIAISKA